VGTGRVPWAKNFVKRGTTRLPAAFWDTSSPLLATIFSWPSAVARPLLNRASAARASWGIHAPPFIVPTVLSTFAWRWMFDPTFRVLSALYQGGSHHHQAALLSDGTYVACGAPSVVNTWRGMPFTPSPSARDFRHQPGPPGGGLPRRRQRAGTASGSDLAPSQAGHRFWWCVFSIIQTFSDFSIYVLTGGRPGQCTHFSRPPYQIGSPPDCWEAPPSPSSCSRALHRGVGAAATTSPRRRVRSPHARS